VSGHTPPLPLTTSRKQAFEVAANPEVPADGADDEEARKRCALGRETDATAL